MKDLLPRERVLALLAGQPTDRSPAMPITMMWASDHIGSLYRDYATRAELMAAGQELVAKRFNIDHVSVISDPAIEAHDCGARIYFPDNAPPAIIEAEALLSDPAALHSLRKPDPHKPGSRMANRLEALRLLKAKMGATHFVEGWVEGPCAESADLRGINTLMMDYYDVPDFVHELASFCVDLALDFAKAQIELGADIIGIGDAAASLLSRELYDEFVWPHEKRLVDGVHAAGGRVRLHICGNTLRHVSGMAKLNCEIVDLDYPVNLAEARAEAGPSQVILGNIHPVELVKKGTPAAVRAALKECRRQAGPAWISGAGCEIPRGSPEENVLCFAAIDG